LSIVDRAAGVGEREGYTPRTLNKEAFVEIEYRSPSVSEYTELRRLVGWWDVDEEAVEAGLKSSLFSVVAVEGGKTAAFGRVVGDGGLYFYLQDLIVHPDFQARGLGKRLMRELMDYVDSHAKSGAFVGLMAARGLESYYEAFGFKARDPKAPGMYLIVE
jgi:GNAT superfamily N-acetyltransferase